MANANPDLLVIGAGPAGIAAALQAADAGLSTVLLDENASPGGRIWQALERRGASDADDAAALALIQRLRASSVEAHWTACVWAIEPDKQVFFSQGGASHVIVPKTILLATGAMERPMPIQGWTLPGVMTVGSAQIALKTGGLLPDERTWIAGQGPLLLLYANQVLDAGGRVAGIIDLSQRFAWTRAARAIALSALPELRKGLAWRKRLRRLRWVRATDVRAEGDMLLEAVSFRVGGAWQTEPADTLLLHDGVIPPVQITRAMGLEHVWNTAQHCWQPAVNDWGVTSVPDVLVAGDGAGIGGAEAAVLSGRIAVLGLLNRVNEAKSWRARRSLRLAIRPVLDALYPPLALVPDDGTLVCRCEEVTAGQVRKAVADGCQGMNQLKAYTRCGMGACQGRMCGPVAQQVIAAARGVRISSVEPLRTRFPTKPVAVGELTGLLA